MSKEDKIKEFWDSTVLDYDHHMETTGHYDAQKKLLKKFSNYVKSPVLDLASGTGFLAGELISEGINVTLNDFSKEMYDFFVQKYEDKSGVSFSNQNAELISFNKKFKTVVCCNLFYYLQDRKNAISHWKDLLDKEGHIILFEEYPFITPNNEVLEGNSKSLTEIIDPINPQEIEEIFDSNNLQLITKEKVAIDEQHDLFGFVFKDK